MVTEFGMSDKLGPRTFGHKEELVFLGREITEQRNYSEKVAREIDEEIHKIIQHAYEVAKKVLTKDKKRLINLAQKLIAQETLEGAELEALLIAPVPSPLPKVKAKAKVTATPAPTPEETTVKTKSKAKKAPLIPEPLPKQAPATSS